MIEEFTTSCILDKKVPEEGAENQLPARPPSPKILKRFSKFLIVYIFRSHKLKIFKRWFLKTAFEMNVKNIFILKTLTCGCVR